ncbi:hypothetical protein [Variovorax sp. YR216]|uniref:hypothetical protein n=1 Tax=Variovorax sp. YR216 TaxID=1882828 RepID=UPI003524D781
MAAGRLDAARKAYEQGLAIRERLAKADRSKTGWQRDLSVTDAIAKATRDAVLAFMAAQGEADYLNRREMQRRGIEVAKGDPSKYQGRPRTYSAQEVAGLRAEHFGRAASTASRLCAEVREAA